MNTSTPAMYLLIHMLTMYASLTVFVWSWKDSKKQPTKAKANWKKFVAMVSLMFAALDAGFVLYYLVQVMKSP